MMSQQKAIKLIVSAQQHLKDIYNEKIPAIAYSDRNMAISCLTQARAELAEQPEVRMFRCKHFRGYSQSVPLPFGSGSCSEELGDCAIESESEDCTLECPDYKESPDCKQPEAGESEALLNVLKIYAETDEPVSQQFYQGLCLKAKKYIDQQAKRIEQLEVSLKIAVDYVKNPNSRRTLEGQLKDIETGHY